MKYFVYKNEVQDGPYSKEDLALMMIYPRTLILLQGENEWKEAKEIYELSDIIVSKPPPIPEGKIGYDKVEDIAGVNYKTAGIITVIYVILLVFFQEMAYTSILGSIALLVLPFVIWRYFKKFFQQLDDTVTGGFINWIYVAYALFWPTFTFIIAQDWKVLAGRSIIEILVGLTFEGLDPSYVASTPITDELIMLINILLFAMFIITVCIWIAGIKLLKINNRYDFPLKRIAISSMICIPVYMFFIFGSIITDEPPGGVFKGTLFSLPYIFLSIHFFRADAEDATPD